MTLLAVLIAFLPVSDQIHELPDDIVVTANLNVKNVPDIPPLDPPQPRSNLVEWPDLSAEPSPEPIDDVWYALAVCESGRGGEPTWDYDGTRYSWGNGLFDGGLQFDPGTWTAFDGPTQFAWQATPAQQVEVAERVLASQGWGAWPTCSSKLGLR